MTVDPHDNEYFVIMQRKAFLRGMYAGGKVPRWTASRWEASAFRSRTLAESVQVKTGGEIVKINLMTGEVWNT